MTLVIVHSDLELRKIKIFTVFDFFPSICHEMMGPDAMILLLWMLSLMTAFSTLLFTLIKRLFRSSSLSAIWVVLLHISCCYYVWSKSESVSCSVVSNSLRSMVCSPSSSSVHGIFEARILEQVAIPFSGGSSWPRDWTLVFCIEDKFFSIWVTWKAH